MLSPRDNLPIGQDFIIEPMTATNYFTKDMEGICHGLAFIPISSIILRNYLSTQPLAFGPMLAFINSMSKEQLVKKLNEIQYEYIHVVNQANTEALNSLGVINERNLTETQKIEFQQIKRNLIDAALKNLSTEGQQLLNVANFFGVIRFIHHPDILNGFQKDEVTFPLALPEEMDQVGGLLHSHMCVDEKQNISAEDCQIFGAYNDEELEKFFKLLAKHLQQVSIKFKHPIAIGLSNTLHAITVGYDPKTQEDWYYIDSNNLRVSTLKQHNIHKGVRLAFSDYKEVFTENAINTEGEYQNFLNLAEPNYFRMILSAFLYGAGDDQNYENILNWLFSKPTIMSAKLYAAGDDKEALKELFSNLKKDPEWIEIHTLLDKSKRIDKTKVLDCRGNNLLIIAAEQKNVDQVKFLISHGANINQKNMIKVDALLYASLHGSLEIVKEILDNQKFVLNTDQDVRFYLRHVISTGRHLILNEYINHYNLKLSKEDLEYSLAISAQWNQYECVELLLKKGINPNTYSLKQTNNPLALAVLGGHSQIVSLLLEKMTETDLTSSINSLLQLAIKHNYVSVLELLIKYINTHKMKIYPSIYICFAIEHDHPNALALFLKPGEDLSIYIEAAMLKGSLKCINLLLKESISLKIPYALTKMSNLYRSPADQIENLSNLLKVDISIRNLVQSLFDIRDLLNADPITTRLIVENAEQISIVKECLTKSDWINCKANILACVDKINLLNIINPLYLEPAEFKAISKQKCSKPDEFKTVYQSKFREIYQYRSQIISYLKNIPLDKKHLAKELLIVNSVTDIIDVKRNIFNAMHHKDLTKKQIDFINELCTKNIIPSQWQKIIIKNADNFLYLIETNCIRPDYFNFYYRQLPTNHLANLENLLESSSKYETNDLKKLLDCGFQFQALAVANNPDTIHSLLLYADDISNFINQLLSDKKKELPGSDQLSLKKIENIVNQLLVCKNQEEVRTVLNNSKQDSKISQTQSISFFSNNHHDKENKNPPDDTNTTRCIIS